MELLLDSDTIVLIFVLCTYALIFPFFIWYFRGNWIKRIRIPSHLPKEGLAFQILGVSSLLCHNSLFPKIMLFENYFEYRIIFKKKVNYSEINRIETKKYSIMPKNIIIYLKDGKRLWLTIGKEENLNELIAFFGKRSISQ